MGRDVGPGKVRDLPRRVDRTRTRDRVRERDPRLQPLRAWPPELLRARARRTGPAPLAAHGGPRDRGLRRVPAREPVLRPRRQLRRGRARVRRGARASARRLALRSGARRAIHRLGGIQRRGALRRGPVQVHRARAPRQRWHVLPELGNEHRQADLDAGAGAGRRGSEDVSAASGFQ